MGTPITAYILILALIAAFTNADSINPNSALAAFGLRAKIDGKKTIAPHVFYQSTDGIVREVYWATSKEWKEGGFQSESGFRPRSNTPLAVASLPADDNAQVVRMTEAKGIPTAALDTDVGLRQQSCISTTATISERGSGPTMLNDGRGSLRPVPGFCIQCV